MGQVITITDDNFHQHLAPVVDGQQRMRGLIPRDYSARPVGYCESAKSFPDSLLIDRAEWQDRLSIQKRDKARLLDVRNRGMNGKPIPSRDQNGKGYCWAHSSTSVMLLLRALMNEAYADLSSYAIACIVKNYRDEGGDAMQSIEFIAKRGVPTSAFWPQQSMDRKNDNAKTWENAAKHEYIRWYDLEPGNLDQLVSCYLRNMPVAGDCNAWGHSIAYVALEEIDPKRPEDMTDWIWNSWGDSWSDNGMGKMHGSKARPNAMTAGCVATGSED